MKRVLTFCFLAVASSMTPVTAQESICDKRATLAACQACVVSGPHVRQEIPLSQRQAWCRQFYGSDGKRLARM